MAADDSTMLIPAMPLYEAKHIRLGTIISREELDKKAREFLQREMAKPRPDMFAKGTSRENRFS